MPFTANPPANVTACASAIPTSKYLSGNSLAKLTKPVPSRIAAVIATISLLSCAKLQDTSPKTF